MQPIISLFNKLMTSDLNSDRKFGYLRRLMAIATNSGLSLPHLDSIIVLFDDSELHFESKYFHRVGFDFDDFRKLPVENAFDQLKVTQKCFRNVLLQNSNEYTLNGFAWFPLLTAAFMIDVFSHSDLKFRLEQEWHVQELFESAHSERKIDWVVLLESLSDSPDQSIKPCPVLIVESGVEPAPGLHEHKDQTKSSCIMSACCVNLAYELARCGKKPELARVYGLLIGSTSARFVVARPVVNRRSDGKYEIKSHVCSEEDWHFDLRDPDVAEEPTVDKPSVYPGFEKELNPGESEKLPNIPHDKQPIGFKLVKDFDGLRRSRGVSRAIPFEGQLTETGVKKTILIAEVVKARISLVRSNAAKDDVKREFIKPSSNGIFYSTSGRAGHGTPGRSFLKSKSAVTFRDYDEAEEDLSSSPCSKRRKMTSKPTFSLTKPSCELELHITRHLSNLFPGFFARLYSAESNSDGTITFEFEQMQQLYDRDGFLHPLFNSHSGHEMHVIFECAKFLLDCSFGLHLLHSCAGIIHSDISVMNIMYSPIYRTWKIIDFGQSLPITQSLTTFRRAGTKHFRAPEAEATGIFNELSDICSLGKVGDFLFGLMLVNVSLEVEGDECLLGALLRIHACFRRMQDDNPAKRPSLIEVMNIAVGVLESLDGYIDLEPLKKHHAFTSVKSLLALKESKVASEVDSQKNPVEPKPAGKLSLESAVGSLETTTMPVSVETDLNKSGRQEI